MKEIVVSLLLVVLLHAQVQTNTRGFLQTSKLGFYPQIGCFCLTVSMEIRLIVTVRLITSIFREILARYLVQVQLCILWTFSIMPASLAKSPEILEKMLRLFQSEAKTEAEATNSISCTLLQTMILWACLCLAN